MAILTTDRAFLPSELTAAGFFLRPVGSPGPAGDPNAIRVSTVQAFKGLESTCVVLVGLTEIDSPAARRLIYVGGSRAKSVLKLLLPQSVAGSFQSLLPRIQEGIQRAVWHSEVALDP